MHILLDTGPLVALLNRRDTFHIWSVEKARNLSPPFYTCEAILAEAHFLLASINQGNRRLIDLLSSGKIVCTPVASRNLNRVGELMMTYANVPMSFADACLVCMAEDQVNTIFTLDHDFRIYRKNRKEVLQLLLP